MSPPMRGSSSTREGQPVAWASRPCRTGEDMGGTPMLLKMKMSRASSFPRQRLGGFIEEREPAAVSLVEVFLGEDLIRRAAGDDAHVQQHDVVEVLRHGLKVVVHDQRGSAGVAQVLEDAHDRL